MIRPTEEAEVRSEEWPDDDTAREYAELAEIEELDAEAPAAERWRVEAAGEALLGPADDLAVLAELEAEGEWPLRLAEAERTEDRVARCLEGLEPGRLAALAPWRDEGELPDDDTAREVESMP